MKQRSDGATVLLGMREFVVGAQLGVGWELWLMVETTSGVVGCEGCGTRAVGHGRRRLKMRDLPMADRPAVLVWGRAGCGVARIRIARWARGARRSTTSRPGVDERARTDDWSPRGVRLGTLSGPGLRGWLGHCHGRGARPRPPTCRSSFPARRSRGLGVDEHSFLAATAEHLTLLATGFVDLDRHPLLAVVQGRTAQGVSGWLAARPGRGGRPLTALHHVLRSQLGSV
jgi:hypothetical protein